jgi:hypothetical protein
MPEVTAPPGADRAACYLARPLRIIVVMPYKRLSIVLSLLLLASCATTRDPTTHDQAPGTCEVHGVALRTDTVPIVYGLVRSSPATIKAREASFPHAETEVLGGCVVREDQFAQVKYCPECHKAKAQWEASARRRA